MSHEEVYRIARLAEQRASMHHANAARIGYADMAAASRQKRAAGRPPAILTDAEIAARRAAIDRALGRTA